MTEDLVRRLERWAGECEEQHGPGTSWAKDMRLASSMITFLNEEWHLAMDQVERLRDEMHLRKLNND